MRRSRESSIYLYNSNGLYVIQVFQLEVSQTVYVSSIVARVQDVLSGCIILRIFTVRSSDDYTDGDDTILV